MRNNKGYSLAELLLSMAIFSIVMLSIVTVMRNVSISYRNENTEVSLQENAQLVLSQMEELLVDCKSVSKAGNTYTIVDSTGVVHSVKLEGDTVKYKYGSSAYEDLAKNVKSLNVSGIQAAHGDNVCVVSVEMEGSVNGQADGRKYTYDATKDVVFRNDVEKADVHDSSFLSGTGTTTTTPPTPNTVSVSMGRYQLLNLIADYNIDTSKTITLTGDTTAYNFVSEAGLNSSNYMANVTKLAVGNTSGYLTTSDTCNSSTGTAYSCQVKGTTKDNKEITLNISTPAVSLKKGSGIVYIPINAVNNGANKNYYSYIEIEGLSVRDAKVYFNKTCTGKLEFSVPGNSAYSGNVFDCSADWNNSLKFGQFKANNVGGMQANTGLGYDPFSTDVLGVMFDSKVFEAGDTSKHNTFNSAKYNVKVSITYPSGTSTATSSQTYTLFTAGANLNNLP